MANDIAGAAEAILAALRENTVFPESLSRRLTLDEGYAVQFDLLRRRKARGDVHVGWKVGLTSRAMQLQQGVHEPCLGHLVEAGHVSSPAVFRFDDLMAPGFENELCIRLRAPLDGGANAESARSAIDAIAPAIEVVEKRGVFNADLPLAFAGNAQQRASSRGNSFRSPTTPIPRPSRSRSSSTAGAGSARSAPKCWAPPSTRWSGWRASWRASATVSKPAI